MREIGIILAFFLLVALLTSCVTETKREYYETGQLKSEYQYDGFVQWSSGNNKQLPLSNLSFSVVGK